MINGKVVIKKNDGEPHPPIRTETASNIQKDYLEVLIC